MSLLEDTVNDVKKISESAGMTLSHHQCEQLAQYLLMLQKWNRTYNLTAIEDLSKMLTYHLADSLSVAQYLSGSRILDVGTGGGLPGVPLAIVCPKKQFVLLDSVSKKTRFLKQVVAELGLSNVVVESQRVESYNTTVPIDVIMARAFASCEKILALTQHLCNPSSIYLLQKGVYPAEEIKALKVPYSVEAVNVPGLDASRHLVIIKNGVNDGKNHCSS